MTLIPLGWAGVALSVIVAIVLCVHVVRTNQAMYWLWIILAFQPFGAIIYFFAVLWPDMNNSATMNRARANASQALDPGREYREAKAALATAPTVGNRLRLAKAAADAGSWSEAEALFAAAGQGIHADDPAVLAGHAQSLVELNRYAEALEAVERLGSDRELAPHALLLRARALQGLGRFGDAESAFEAAVGRMPGVEALGRYCAFLAETGRVGEAREVLADIDRRIAATNAQFRREAMRWRELAARRLIG